MKTTLALLICVLSTNTSFAQPDTLWTRFFGSNGNDIGTDVRQTCDGGYIVTGFFDPSGFGLPYVYLIKTNDSGNEQWSRIFGGSNWDIGLGVLQTSDEGYIIVGRTESLGSGSSDVYLIKTDDSGIEQWNQTLGGNEWDFGNDILQVSDGGYIIAGGTQSYGAGGFDMYLIKTDDFGVEQWSQTFGGSEDELCYDLQQTFPDSGYIITGKIESYGAVGSDVYLVKTDAFGIEQWAQTFGGSEEDGGSDVLQTLDGGYIVTGYTYSYGAGGRDVYLIKTDASGNEQWSRTFGGNLNENGNSIIQSDDGGYVIVGDKINFAASWDVYLIKTDASGNEIWSQTFGGDELDYGYRIRSTTDGGFIIVGTSNSFSNGYYDVWLIRLAPDSTGVIQLELPQPLTYSLLPAYPNPFNPSTLIRFQIPVAGDVQILLYDIQGNLVTTLTDGWQTPGSYQVPFNAANLSSGIYLARLTTGDFTQTQKLVLLK